MNKLISIGLALVLLVGCGGGTTTTTVPTSVGTERGAAATMAPVSPDVTTSTTDTQATSMPSTDATAQPTEAASVPAPAGAAIDPATVTQEVTIADLGMTLKVPAGWEQVAGENAWSASGAESPRIGVTSAQITPDWRPSSMLPEGATVKSSEVQTLPLGQVNLYTVENSDGTAETHTIIRSAETAYNISARATSLQELRSFQPVLNAVLNSVELNAG